MCERWARWRAVRRLARARCSWCDAVSPDNVTGRFCSPVCEDEWLYEGSVW